MIHDFEPQMTRIETDGSGCVLKGSPPVFFQIRNLIIEDRQRLLNNTFLEIFFHPSNPWSLLHTTSLWQWSWHLIQHGLQRLSGGR